MRILTLIFVLLSTPAFAVDPAVKSAFWSTLAPLGPSLYCEADVAELLETDTYSVEHVYPSSWMRTTLGCEDCDNDPAYRVFDNDLHNLWPAEHSVNSARGNRAFADLVAADDWRGGECAFRSRGEQIMGDIALDGLVEPRDEVKGMIARTLLHVRDTYGGQLPITQLETALDWHQRYPTTELECARAAVILELQGTINSWLDCP
ncbi:endonuclease [Pelagibacterium sp.]|uniref:endonuclease n=1 Tax=Pelagibacterium sp. TaxID=1967288 RepID=UPI003A8EA26F